MKNVIIVSATKDNGNGTMIEKYKDSNQCTVCIERNNKSSLASVYNKYINEINKNNIIVFVHDDALIEDLFLIEKLNDAVKEFDIIGLAGTKPNIILKQPVLWHLMCSREQHIGAVAHFYPNESNKRFVTNFGPTPERAILLDGVFLAINVEKALETGLKFDETNPARFHFYDLDLCLTANKLCLKYGTWPIWLTHKSHGLIKPDEEFLKGQEWFLKKWKNQ